MAVSTEAVVFILGFLVFGSLNTLCTKLQFSLTSVGLAGEEKPFSKPWFGSYRMFLAMFLVLITYVGTGFIGYMVRALTKKSASDADASDGEGQGRKAGLTSILPKMSLSQFLFIALPACFDLMASSMSFVGLLYISASTWQMLRGSMIIFNSILFVLFLGRRLYAYNWAGVGLCTCGILMVGGAGVLAASESASEPSGETQSQTSSKTDKAAEPAASSDVTLKLVGTALVIFGQLIQAGQVVVEEKILKSGNTEETPLEPAVVVGLEGLWGTLILTFIGFPLLYFVIPGSDYDHCQENIFDTIAMLQNSSSLQVVIGLYLISCSLYNFCGMSITKYLNSIHRTMLDAWRTLFIWGSGLYYHYYVDESSAFGEVWTKYSYLQLAGFSCLICGQLVYGGLLRFESVFYYPDSEEKTAALPVKQDSLQELVASVVSFNPNAGGATTKSRSKSAKGGVPMAYISPCSNMNLVEPLPISEEELQHAKENSNYDIVATGLDLDFGGNDLEKGEGKLWRQGQQPLLREAKSQMGA